MTILLRLKVKKKGAAHTKIKKKVLSTKRFRLFLLFPAWCILVATIVLALVLNY